LIKIPKAPAGKPPATRRDVINVYDTCDLA
jgi:hypothetical protein